jgi:DNA repair protein RadC
MNIYMNDLPRLKLRNRGASALSDLELLQVVVGNGCSGRDFKSIAKDLYAVINKVGFEQLTLADVTSVKGIGDSKGSIIFAMLELYRRAFEKQTAPLIDTPEKAAEQFSYNRRSL